MIPSLRRKKMRSLKVYNLFWSLTSNKCKKIIISFPCIIYNVDNTIIIYTIDIHNICIYTLAKTLHINLGKENAKNCLQSEVDPVKLLVFFQMKSDRISAIASVSVRRYPTPRWQCRLTWCHWLSTVFVWAPVRGSTKFLEWFTSTCR